jgi:hypothetical protein
MKNYIISFLIFISSPLISFSQNGNVVFFAEQGERFSVVMNGLRINDRPETNIKVADLAPTNFKVKIIFEDASIPDMDKTVFITPGEEMTFNVRKNKKGEYILAYYSQAPIAQAAPAPSSQRVIVYNQVPPNDGIVIRGGTTTTTTTTTTTGTPNTVGASVNIGGIGMNVTINDGTGTMMSNGTTTTTYSTTTTTTSNTANNNQTFTNTQGCIYPMNAGDFSAAKSSISSKSFEDSKVTIAKQVIDANCLSVSQIKNMMELMTFEENKLTIAKYAYTKSTDPNNYYLLNDAFTFESTIDDLNAYINANRR